MHCKYIRSTCTRVNNSRALVKVDLIIMENGGDVIIQMKIYVYTHFRCLRSSVPKQRDNRILRMCQYPFQV